MTAMYVIGAWFAIATVLTAAWARLGYLRQQVRKVNVPSPFGQQSRGNLSELGGLSQRHSGAFTHD